MICPRCGAEFDQERCPLCFYEPQVVEEVAVQADSDEQAKPTPSPIQMTAQTMSAETPQEEIAPMSRSVDSVPQEQASLSQQTTEQPVTKVLEQNVPFFSAEETMQAPQESAPTPDAPKEETADGVLTEVQSVECTAQQETEAQEHEQEYHSCPKCGNVITGVYCSHCGYYQPKESTAFFTENYAVYCEERNLKGKKSPLKNTSANKVWMILTIVAVGILFLAYIVGVFLVAFFTAFALGDEVIVDGPIDEYYAQEWEESFPDFGNRDDVESFFEEYFGMEEESKPQQEALYPNGVSLQEYQQLEVGMSYAQISAIIGGDGTVVESNGNSLLIYWSAETGEEGIGVVIEFQDQTAVAIEQRGLE